MAVIHHHFESIDPFHEGNLKDKYRGLSAMTDAAGNNNSKYLKLLLTYRGDPNVLEDALVKEGDLAKETTC